MLARHHQDHYIVRVKKFQSEPSFATGILGPSGVDPMSSDMVPHPTLRFCLAPCRSVALAGARIANSSLGKLHRIYRNQGWYRCFLPICSMYGIFTYIYHKFKPNVGKYTIHGAYGLCIQKKLLQGEYLQFVRTLRTKKKKCCDHVSPKKTNLNMEIPIDFHTKSGDGYVNPIP